LEESDCRTDDYQHNYHIYKEMPLQLQSYTFTLTYKQGKEITLADTLSAVYLENEQTLKSFNEDFVCAVVCFIVFLNTINL